MIILVPAYGRKYATKQEALRDWHKGLDFKIAEGPYTSVRDLNLLKESFSSVVIHLGFTSFDVECPFLPVV